MPTHRSRRRLRRSLAARRALGAVLAAGLLATGAASADTSPASAQSPPSAGLRVATFNTYLLSPAMRCLSHLVEPESVASVAADFATCLASDATEDHAHQIAKALVARADDYDVLALNEVWDEDARRILVEALEPIFPRYVAKLDVPLVQSSVFGIPGTSEEFKFNFEDSGLMLFARDFLQPHPLPKLPAAAAEAPVYLGSGYDRLPLPPTGLLPVDTVEGTIPYVAFTGFGDACAIEDCLATKGAGLVRFLDSRNEDLVNVAFTHLQAEDDHADVRERQMEAIRHLVNSAVDLGSSTRELLFVVGDLNVKGEDQAIQAPGGPEGAGEWAKRFGDPGSWSKSTVHDAWALTTSERDRGITHAASGERLDYVLANRLLPGSLGWAPADMDAGRCVQQLTVEMVEAPSDHAMVRADANRPFHYCDPRAAWVNPPVDAVLGPNPAAGPGDTTRIRFPGSVQWLHVIDPTASAYEIGFAKGSMPIEATVYAPDDLTTPIAPYREKQVEKQLPNDRPFVGTQYVLPPEFYVRLRAAVPGATGDIRPVLHKMRCDSLEEACPLDPASPQVAAFPAATALGADDTAWFRVDVTQQADSGLAQQLRVVADQLDPAKFKVDVVDAADPWGASPYPSAAAPDAVTHDVVVPEPATYYLRIARGGPDGTATQARAAWHTNLQLMELRRLSCLDETNGFAGSESGHDEINVEFGVDGAPRWLTGSSGSWISYDCDNWTDEKDVSGTTLRFLGDATSRIWEIDDASPNDHGDAISLAANGATLAPDQAVGGGRLAWKFEGGHYSLDYDLRRRPNAPVL